MKRIRIDQIGYDPDYYPRANGREDWYTVNVYKSALLANPSLAFGWTPEHPDRGFPPVVVVRATAREWLYLLLDGLHRLRTYHAAGYEDIPATVERLPESRWLARSVELNVAGKRGLDVGDKAFIARKLEAAGWAVGDVAALLQMQVETLEKIKASRVVKLTAGAARKIVPGRSNREIDGKHYGFLKAPFVPLAGTANVQEALEAQGPVAARDAAHVLDSAIAVLACGVDMADEEIARRVERLRELLPEPVAETAA